jgi:hypothetical protein
MNNSSTKISFLMAGLLAFFTFNLTAETVIQDIHSSVVQKAHNSEKGVIMVLSASGDVAAQSAYLLSEQLSHNPGYLPLLMVPKEPQLNAYANQLGLSKDTLPAVIFYDKAGVELGRMTGRMSGKRVVAA